MKIKKNKIRMTVFEKAQNDDFDFNLQHKVMTCRVYHKQDLLDTITVPFEKLATCLNSRLSDYDAWQFLKQHRLSIN